MTFWRIVAFILQVAIGTLPVVLVMNLEKVSAWAHRVHKWMWEEET